MYQCIQVVFTLSTIMAYTCLFHTYIHQRITILLIGILHVSSASFTCVMYISQISRTQCVIYILQIPRTQCVMYISQDALASFSSFPNCILRLFHVMHMSLFKHTPIQASVSHTEFSIHPYVETWIQLTHTQRLQFKQLIRRDLNSIYIYAETSIHSFIETWIQIAHTQRLQFKWLVRRDLNSIHAYAETSIHTYEEIRIQITHMRTLKFK